MPSSPAATIRCRATKRGSKRTMWPGSNRPGAFLAALPTDGPTASSHVHTHVHLAADGCETAGSEGVLGADAEPIISVNDRIMHLTTFTDPLAAALILSIYPDRRVLKLYGYAPDGTFEEQSGYWALPRKVEPRGGVHDDT